MRFTRFQNALIAVVLSFIVFTGVHAISSVNPTPGQSEWTVTSNIGVVLDEVTPYQPTEISDSDAVGSTVTISSPGIFRLSAPMTKKIVISSNNVELDLNEYGVTVSSAVTAITVGPGVSNVIVRNGHVIGSGGATTGILVDGSSTTSKVFIKNIRISGFVTGIHLNGTGGSVELCEVTSCTANSNSGIGFDLAFCESNILSHCNAKTNNFGFVCADSTKNIISNCVATLNVSTGFMLSTGADNNLLTNCSTISNSVGFNISTGTDNLIQHCVAMGNVTNFSGLGSNFSYQNKDINAGFSWNNNVPASP